MFNVILAAAMAWPASIEPWRSLIEKCAERNGLDPGLVAAVIWHESRGDPFAVSPAGALGLMQVMPYPWRPPPEELLRPGTNVAVGTRVLRRVIDIMGNRRAGLAAFQCGFDGLETGHCGRGGGYSYADRVLRTCRRFGGCRVPGEGGQATPPGVFAV